MLTIEKLKARHPELWTDKARVQKCLSLADQYGWRWEFIRRSALYREQCDSIRARLEQTEGDYLPGDRELARLCFAWGLYSPAPGVAVLCLDYETGFANLLNGLCMGARGKDWRGHLEDAAKSFTSEAADRVLPGDYLQVSDSLGPDRYYQQVKVGIPPGGSHHAFFGELSKNPPRLTERPEVVGREINLSVPPSGWQRFPVIADFDGTDLQKIVDAMLAAYGVPLPEVVPKKPGGRLRTGDLHKQVTALDIAAGKLTVKDADIDPIRWTRFRDQGLEKIRLLEAIATQRRAVFDVT